MAGIEEHILTFVKNFLTAVGYPGIFVLMTVEGVGIPIPSELSMPFSGFLASGEGGNRLFLPVVIVVGALGEVTGSVIMYALGYFGGRRMLERYGRFVFISEHELEKGEHWFRQYGDWIVLVTRLLPAVRSFVPLPAGVVRMPFWRFLVYSLLGSAVWCAVLAIIGHVLGQHWTQLSVGFRKYNPVIIAVVLAAIAFALYKRMFGGNDEEDIDDSHRSETPIDYSA